MPILICLLVALLFAEPGSASEPLKLYMPDAPPLTFQNYQGGYGMVGDVTLAAIALSGRLGHIVVEPWPRAQRTVANGNNLLIIPLLRTPDREALYTWIAPIMPLERVFFSLDDPVQSFAEARQRYRRIGVGLGTAQVEILHRQGFSNDQVVCLRLGESPARLLEMGRIDAWFTGVPEGLYIWHRFSSSSQSLRMSPVLASTDLYLACSKDCDPQLVAELRAAVLYLHNQGVSLRLRQAYLPDIL